MKLTVGNKSVKYFTKTLRFMAKYSNDLFVHAYPEFIIFKAVNSTQTVVAHVKFEETFFLNYQLSKNEEGNIAKVPFRPLLNAIKNYRAVSETSSWMFCSILSGLILDVWFVRFHRCS